MTGCGPNASSLGRGGISLVVSALTLCRRLRLAKVSGNCLKSAWEPLSAALANLPELEDLSMRTGTDEKYPMLLSTERLASLVKSWPNLKTLDLYELRSAASTTPSLSPAMVLQPFTCNLVNVALTQPDCPAAEIEALLEGVSLSDYLKYTLLSLFRFSLSTGCWPPRSLAFCNSPKFNNPNWSGRHLD